MASGINYYNALLGKLYDDGKEMPLRGGLNFVGFDVTPSQFGYDLTLAAQVPGTRKVTAGLGLIGGGDLSVDRVIDVAPGDATIVAGADSLTVGVLGSTNFADNTILPSRLVNASAPGRIMGRSISGGPQWAECLPSELNLVTNLANTIALANLVNATAQFNIMGRRTAGAGAWEQCTAAQLNLLTTAANSIALAGLVNASAQFSIMGRKTAGAGAWEDCTAAQLNLIATTSTNALPLAGLVNASAQFRMLGRKSAGAGAWQDCAPEELNVLPVFNVKAYGAVGDGVADDFAAANNARLAAVAAGGGVVFFPPGQYRLTAGLVTALSSNIIFRGAGSRTTYLRPEQNTDVFGFNSGVDGCGVEDLSIERTAGNWPNAGSAIAFDTTTRCFVRRVNIAKGANGISATKSPDLDFTDIKMFQMFAGRGFSIEGQAANTTDRTRIVNFTGRNPYGATPVRRGAWATATAYAVGDVVLSNSAFWQAQNAATSGATAPILAAGPVATAHTTNVSDGAVNWRFIGPQTQWIFLYDYQNNTTLTNCRTVGGDYGVVCVGTGNLQSGLRSTGLDIQQAYSQGVLLDRGNDAEFTQTSIVQTLDLHGFGIGNFAGNLRLNGGTISLSRASGINIAAGSDIHIRNFRIANNAQIGAGGAWGIVTAAGITSFSIVGCVISGANQAAGIAIGATNDQFTIACNDVNGNVAGLTNGSRDTATKQIVRNNSGDDSDVATKYYTAQTGAIASTQLHTATLPKGLYRLSYYCACTTNGSGLIGVSFAWTDDRQARTFSSTSIDMSGPNFKAETVVAEVASGAITFSTTGAPAGGAAYSLRVTMERVTNVSP